MAGTPALRPTAKRFSPFLPEQNLKLIGDEVVFGTRVSLT